VQEYFIERSIGLMETEIHSYLCIKAKTASFLSESQFYGRGAAKAYKQARIKGTLNFLGDRTKYKAKGINGKIINLFCIYLFQIDTFININSFL
jgi:hypothetical protein